MKQGGAYMSLCFCTEQLATDKFSWYDSDIFFFVLTSFQ